MARAPQHHSSAGRAWHHRAAAARAASLPTATLQDGAAEKGGDFDPGFFSYFLKGRRRIGYIGEANHVIGHGKYYEVMGYSLFVGVLIIRVTKQGRLI